MSRQSLQAFRRTITVAWPKGTERNAKALLLKTARAGHARIMGDAKARSGAVPTWEAFANRPGNTNLASVVLPGPIVYKYKYLTEIVEFALEALRRASPVRSGAYVNSHSIYVNGTEVTTPPKEITRGMEIMLANPIVYARRIEIGKTKSGRDFVIQVPNRIYERVAKQILIPKYRNVARITFGYSQLPQAYKTKAGLSGSYGIAGGRTRKRRQVAGAAVRAPAIFIEALA